MTTRTAATLLAWLTEHEEEMVTLLEELVLAESPSYSPESLRGPLEILTRELQAQDFVVRHIAGGEFGDHLCARPHGRYRHRGYQLLIGHLDTVWPHGSGALMPFRRVGGEIYGPGVFDMKGGLVEIVFALGGLAANGLVPEVTPVVFVNADEEVGSVDSRRHLTRLAGCATRALVLEGASGRHGKLKIARKGGGRFTLTVHGRASHAGSSPEEGVSAILELAEQIRSLNELNDAARGVSVNVGVIDGGLRPNVIAPVATAEIDVRVPTATDAARLERAIRERRATLPGATVVVTGGFRRPALERNPANEALLRRAEELAEILGFHVEDAGLIGGGSDANLTSPLTATLDGLGPIGDGAHAVDERIVASSLAQRAALLALLVLEPDPRRPTPQPHHRRRYGSRVYIVGTPAHLTNRRLVPAWSRLGIEVELAPARAVRALVRPGDIVLGRLDALPTLDGVEPGLFDLFLLERAGVTVLNQADALLACHDKWRTARVLQRASLPHPRTELVMSGGPVSLRPPVVVKPRFGSWGADVERCESDRELDDCLARATAKPWFKRHGALVQEFVPSAGVDVRVVVARNEVVGAIERVARPGEWRTNVSLGAARRPVQPSDDASALAIAAAAAVEGDLVGVDVLPLAAGGCTIIELNGAVDFTSSYGLEGRDAFEDAAVALGLEPSRMRRDAANDNAAALGSA